MRPIKQWACDWWQAPRVSLEHEATLPALFVIHALHLILLVIVLPVLFVAAHFPVLHHLFVFRSVLHQSLILLRR
jgi:hypothetical protein